MFQKKLQQSSKRNPAATIHTQKEHNANTMSRSRTVKRAMIDKNSRPRGAWLQWVFCVLRTFGKCLLSAHGGLALPWTRRPQIIS
jgi:hypothetical protein